MKTLPLLVCFLAAFAQAGLSQDMPTETVVFTSGEGGYHTYRIPSVIATKGGSLLAFCEGRKGGRGDAGDIDLVYRRSNDGGKTWSKQQVLWDDAENTCGNPCPVVDQESGHIYLWLTWNAGKIVEGKVQGGFGEDSRRVFLAKSTDDGKTWSPPQDMTSQAKDKSWSWYATGPGAGIQIVHGKFKGRLVIPCDHKLPAEKDNNSYSHVLYSDDHGATWKLGGSTSSDKCNECEVVELAEGRLLLNMRSHDKAVKNRQVCTSDDGGATWSKPSSDETLIEPICQASIRRYRWGKDSLPSLILFSNPGSTKGREKLTIRGSSDDARSWPISKVLYEGPAAYSCLVVQPDSSIGCLYEKDNYKQIVFAKFTLDWLTK